MKASYLSPACKVRHLSLDSPVLSVNANTWEDSIGGAGSSWGGLDTDDSIYGL